MALRPLSRKLLISCQAISLGDWLPIFLGPSSVRRGPTWRSVPIRAATPRFVLIGNVRVRQAHPIVTNRVAQSYTRAGFLAQDAHPRPGFPLQLVHHDVAAAAIALAATTDAPPGAYNQTVSAGHHGIAPHRLTGQSARVAVRRSWSAHASHSLACPPAGEVVRRPQPSGPMEGTAGTNDPGTRRGNR
jgi:hypothetical protein